MRAAPRIARHYTSDPVPVAIENMGRAAREAARTFTMQEWAARLATKAPPRDYVAQLGELYKGILARWRYTMEPGERVPGTARAVLGYTLGARYNAPDPENVDVEATPWPHKGWGDCDDVSTLTAAGVLALGMTPVFRVVRWPGGAHVSVVARTPDRRAVSIDPVGHPKHPFGWAARPAGGHIQLFGLDGSPLGNFNVHRQQPAMRGTEGSENMNDRIGDCSTHLAGLDEYARQPKRQRIPRRLLRKLRRHRAMRPGKTTPHVVMVRPGDRLGARVLAVPAVAHRGMLQGIYQDRTPALSQYGEQFEYVAGSDVWAPMGAYYFSGDDMGRSARARRRARRKARRGRRKRFFKRLRRGVGRFAGKLSRSKVGKFFRKIKAKILGSKLVQGLVSRVLNVFGVPAAATKAVLEREASIARQGGRSRILELLAKGDKKGVAKILGKSLKDAAKAAMPGSSLTSIVKKVSGKLRGPEDEDDEDNDPGDAEWDKIQLGEPVEGSAEWSKIILEGERDAEEGVETYMHQDGEWYPVAQVAGIFPAEYEMGDDTSGEMDIRKTPTPGAWFDIGAGGKNLLDTTGRAYGVGAGGTRLKLSKMLNAHPYNRRFWIPPTSDFGKKHYPKGVISYSPKFASAEVQRLDEDDAGKGTNAKYAVIWIPQKDGSGDPPAPPVPPKPDEPKPKR